MKGVLYQRYQEALAFARQARFDWEEELCRNIQVLEGEPPPRGRKIRPKPKLRLIMGGRV
jgi:hypothetical protein